MEYHYTKKSIWKWIALYMIIGAIAYALIYYFLSYKKIYTPQNYQNNYQTQNIVNQTADWGTYKSDLFDYEIKFPSTYKTSPGFISSPYTGTDIDHAFYDGKDYSFSFEIFARSEDFIMRDCLKDLSGKDIVATKEINGNKFYAFEERKIGMGGRMSLTEGAIESEYHAVHNNSCYIVRYTIVPNYLNPSVVTNKTNSEFEMLEKIFSTFKFTK